jgi:hypothetical protein
MTTMRISFCLLDPGTGKTTEYTRKLAQNQSNRSNGIPLGLSIGTHVFLKIAMTLNDFIAHINSTASTPHNEHPLAEHLKETARLAIEYGPPEAAPWLQLAGLWHDLGKYRPGFQRYIRQNPRRPRQGVCGTAQQNAFDRRCPAGTRPGSARPDKCLPT